MFRLIMACTLLLLIFGMPYYAYRAYQTNQEWDNVPVKAVVNAGRLNVSSFPDLDLADRCDAVQNAFVDYKSTENNIYIRCNSVNLLFLGDFYSKFQIIRIDRSDNAAKSISFLF
ncbi:hypothetical protein C9J40_20190 [Photobacterium sp. GB-72]|nr:hypothetical protein C9J40_20190 [Photobacterium sp. GB-72]